MPKARRHHARIRVRYPLEGERISLRGETAWSRDVEAEEVSADGTTFDFRLPLRGAFGYFKPVLHGPDGSERWSVGSNYLAVAGGEDRVREIYPHFRQDDLCSVCELRELACASGSRHTFRVFYPPGYAENTLKRYPVVYMHDGQNLFFPDEAFLGSTWKIAETLELLNSMNAVDKVIVVGIYPEDRTREYTKPGYRAYGRFLAEQLKPVIDADYRTLPGPDSTAVMGSSLGGVASFHLAWEWPTLFGMAACLSSTFGWRDDLRERVASEPLRPVRFYLDSGWPRDNYEATRDMRDLLLSRGSVEGQDLLYFAFPEALHNEQHWATRVHLPFQFFLRWQIKRRRASRPRS